MAQASGHGPGCTDDGGRVGDAHPRDLAVAAERSSGCIRADVLTLRGPDAAAPQPARLASAGQDRRLQVRPTSVTNLIDGLAKAAYAERAPHPDDRRTTLATITPRGREVAAAATEVLNAVRSGTEPLQKESAEAADRGASADSFGSSRLLLTATRTQPARGRAATSPEAEKAAKPGSPNPNRLPRAERSCAQLEVPEEVSNPENAAYDSACRKRESPVDTGDSGPGEARWTQIWTHLSAGLHDVPVLTILRSVGIGRAPRSSCGPLSGRVLGALDHATHRPRRPSAVDPIAAWGARHRGRYSRRWS